eukprot:SAG11_NODE_32630_length_282_cov_0.644809_1_plen_82_part_10
MEDWNDVHVEFTTIVSDIPACDDVYLGPDIGFVSIYEYHDEDASCTLSMAEPAALCTPHVDSYTAFLDGEDPDPEPEPEPVM